MTDQEKIDELEAWVRFLTDNSTDEQEIFDRIGSDYRTSVRWKVAKNISKYFIERDK
jgi:hypothetical protein